VAMKVFKMTHKANGMYEFMNNAQKPMLKEYNKTEYRTYAHPVKLSAWL
jgi:hypothetical protein